jgi:hypothetical protein
VKLQVFGFGVVVGLVGHGFLCLGFGIDEKIHAWARWGPGVSDGVQL